MRRDQEDGDFGLFYFECFEKRKVFVAQYQESRLRHMKSSGWYLLGVLSAQLSEEVFASGWLVVL